ncbi:MAG TPA: phage holin family protein [Opitutus sp.]|nr:phage holin family protein [Opitutus sp.]
MPMFEDESNSEADGLGASLRRIGASLLGLAQTRIELFSVELQEEKLRLLNLLVWFSVAMALAVAGLLVAIGALGLFLWETAGYAGLVGLVVVTLGGAAGLLWMLRRRILRRPAPFAETAAEFKKDLESLRHQ